MEYYTAAEKEDKALQGLPKNLQATLKEGKMKVGEEFKKKLSVENLFCAYNFKH